jgi:hypothetical protein
MKRAISSTQDSALHTELPSASRGIRFPPSLGFMALVAVHEYLSYIAATRWMNDESFVAIQVGWYCLWELALLCFFLVNQLRIRSTLSRGRLLLFWSVQLLWFLLGLWCYGVLFADQPFAIAGVGAWLIVAFILALLCENQDNGETKKEKDDSYFFKTFDRKSHP